MIRILGVSGSLRASSSNTMLLRAAALVAPPEIAFEIEPGLGDLPHFNPDLEGSEPDAVLAFQRRVREAEGVLFSTPEYAHGLPGVLKNGLDWLVGSDAFIEKPFALLNAAAGRAEYARASLIEIARTMSGILIEESFVPVGRPNDAESIIGDDATASAIRAALERFAAGIRGARASRIYQP